MARFVRRLFVVCAALAGVALHVSCTDSTAPVVGDPAGIVIVSGDEQAARVAEQVAAPLVVRVVDAESRPVPGATVQFTASGGGSLTHTTAISLPNGTARTTWTLGPHVAEPQRVQARLTGGGAAASVVFSATAQPGPPTSIIVLAGNEQRRPPGVALRDSVAAQVLDQYENPVADVLVRWRVTGGGGAIVPATSVTDPAGIARAAWTIGPVLGPNTAEAIIDDVSGPAAFMAHGIPGPAITNLSPAVLVPGEVAIITGTSFGSAASEFSVAFNHSDAVIQHADSTQIRVVVPCEPSGPVTVRVQANGAETYATHPQDHRW
jgi:hypothetical protein